MSRAFKALADASDSQFELWACLVTLRHVYGVFMSIRSSTGMKTHTQVLDAGAPEFRDFRTLFSLDWSPWDMFSVVFRVE
jgi:hypothetical protein